MSEASTGDFVLTYYTVQESVVDHLRDLILSRELKPGERLVQSELAAQLGVSRTPIREALHQLASEGLVTLSRYKGASVAEFSPVELEEIYHVRIALEGYAARLAAKNITDEELQQLRELLPQMKEAYEQGERSRLLEVNRQFYLCLYAATRQQRLYELVVNHLHLSRQYRRIYFYLENLAANTVAEHEALLKVLEQRDVEAAEHLTRVYLEETVAGLIEFLQTPE
jgi:DNA-binding GntR family transcriptional regulator